MYCQHENVSPLEVISIKVLKLFLKQCMVIEWPLNVDAGILTWKIVSTRGHFFHRMVLEFSLNNVRSANQNGDKPLKSSWRHYLFSIKTCAKCYNMHKMSKHLIPPLTKYHSSAQQASFGHPRNVIRPHVKCHSFTHEMSLVQTSNIIRPAIKWHSFSCQTSLIHMSNIIR